MNDFEDLCGKQRVMVILRGLPAEQTVAVATRAWDAGVELLEVPIGEPAQVLALAAAVSAGAERGKRVGAGTVLTQEQVRAAAAAGASYTVAPGFDPAVLATSLAAGLPHLPGVATVTEVQHARAAGCTWLKVFPASALGTSWFRAIRGPFPSLNYVATGGITIQTAPEFLDAGARVVGLGAGLTDPSQQEQLAALIGTASAE